MTPLTRKWIMIGGGFVTVAIVVTAVITLLPEEPTPADAGQTATTTASKAPEVPVDQVADTFLTAFRAGDAQATAALTDDPAAAAKQLAAVWQGLRPKQVGANRTQPVVPAPGVSTVEVPFRHIWTFSGAETWPYDSVLPLVKTGEQWRVHWTPTLVHPKLTAERGLALLGRTEQAAVLDRDGKPFLVWQSAGIQAADPVIAPLLIPGMTRVATEQGGKGGWHVALTDASGTELEKLAESGNEGSKPLTTTLSVATQQAAQAAVDSASQPAMLVVIQPSTGEILAVAQNAAAGTTPNALHGLYPPGSTFKIATATAVLEAGAADVDTVLPCPGEAVIGTRRVKNDDFAAGDVPLHTAFARSCNTTFAKLAGALGPDALSDAASQVGLNADFMVPGFDTEAGSVKPAGSSTQRVEDSIGQGTVQASPFGIALMSATVASGKAVTPKLWRGLDTTVTVGYQAPPRAVIDKVRGMMREVVTGGTGSALAGRGTVFGKTGTAQFGDGVHSHGWFTGYRGDLAFAVFLEGGESSKPAVTVAGKFLGAVR